MNDQIEQIAPFRWKVRRGLAFAWCVFIAGVGVPSLAAGLGEHGTRV